MAFLAASRRTEADLAEMQRAADQFSDEIAAGRDGVAADFAFHRALAGAAKNGYFVAHLENLGSWALPRQRIPSELRKIVRDSGQIAQNDREHRAILAAVRDGDAQQAAAGMRLHLGESLMHYKALLHLAQ